MRSSISDVIKIPTEPGDIMLICLFDDERIFCEELYDVLEDYFAENYPHLDYIIKYFTDAATLMDFVLSNDVAVVFLDISSPENENCGLELAKDIRAYNESIHIAFTTSRNDKIINSFDGLIRPSAFLVKPLEKYLLNDLMSNVIKKCMHSPSFITLKFGRVEYLLDYNEIYSIQKTARKTLVCLENRSIEVTNTINSFIEILPPKFVLINKGILINRKMIDTIDYVNKKITLIDDSFFYMSRSGTSLVKKNMQENGDV